MVPSQWVDFAWTWRVATGTHHGIWLWDFLQWDCARGLTAPVLFSCKLTLLEPSAKPLRPPQGPPISNDGPALHFTSSNKEQAAHASSDLSEHLGVPPPPQVLLGTLSLQGPGWSPPGRWPQLWLQKQPRRMRARHRAGQLASCYREEGPQVGVYLLSNRPPSVPAASLGDSGLGNQVTLLTPEVVLAVNNRPFVSDPRVTCLLEASKNPERQICKLASKEESQTLSSWHLAPRTFDSQVGRKHV